MFFKKICVLFGGMLVVGNAFGVCSVTNYTLSQGGDASYDDYLYTSTAKYEKRNEGRTVRAYVCGQSCVGCCGVDEVIRLSNAAIGAGAAKSDAVYKCVNVADADRTGYGWQATTVDSYCMVGAGKFKYNQSLKLYEYNGKYCSEIDEVKELRSILEIDNGNLITIVSSDQDITVQNIYNEIKIRKIKIKNKTLSAADFNKIKKLINKTESEIRKDLDEMGVLIEGMQADIKDLQRDQFWDDVTNRAQNAKLNKFARNMRNMKKDLKTKVNEDQVIDLINNAISDMELTEEQVAQVKSMIEESARKTNMDINKINAKLRNMNWRITKNEAQIAWVRFYNNLRNNSQDKDIKKLGDKLADMEKNMLTESDVENLIEQELKNAKLNRTQLQQIRNQINLATAGLKIKLNRLTKRVDELEADLSQVKTELTKMKVNAWFDGLIQDFKNKKFERAIKNLQKDMKEIPTEDEVMDMIQNAIEEAELNDTQLKQVKDLVGKEIDKLGGDVNKLRKRLNNLSIRVAKLEAKTWWLDMENRFQDLKIDRLNKKMKSLNSKIDEKLNEEQVMDLIEEALSEAELSDAQTKQVEAMIRESAKKANARMDRIDNRLKNLTQRIRKVEWNVFKLKTKLALVDFENDVRYTRLLNKDERLDKAIKKVNQKIKKINSELDEKVSRDEARKMIQDAVDEAVTELGTDLSVEIQNTFNQIVADLNAQVAELVGTIESRLEKVEADVADLQAKNEELLDKISSLQSLTASQRSQINSLRAEVRNKTSAEQVVALILENTKTLIDGQKQEVVSLIVEYTASLSEGQKTQVQAMIAAYVDPKIAELDEAVTKTRQQEVMRDKTNSPMSVLNAFASGADVSVWKNAEGKFNAARLASDATAGVVLGTAGGLISNSIIKKNQLKKGFEDISCSVGGQLISNFGDEFVVGIQ